MAPQAKILAIFAVDLLIFAVRRLSRANPPFILYPPLYTTPPLYMKNLPHPFKAIWGWVDFNKTNPGVWTMTMDHFKQTAGFTSWNQYKQDEPIEEIDAKKVV